MTPLLKIQEPDSQGVDRPSLKVFLDLGFRPLYLAGALWALIAIMLWIFVPQFILGTLQGVLWHGHEMLWGFIVTIAVGFLMTAGANWTGINPLPGKFLGLACVFWVVARIGYLVPGDAAFVLAGAAETGFLGSAAAGMGLAVIKSQNRRNYGVPIVLLALALANLAYLISAHQGDVFLVMRYFHVALICMAILVLLVGRRVIPFFAMRALPGLSIPMHTRTGHWQIGASVAAVVLMLLNRSAWSSVPLALAGLLSIVQILAWNPRRVMGRPILWILYAGYFMTGIGLLVAALRAVDPAVRGAWPIHVIAMGGFSVLIIGMITRTALGHLGRPLEISVAMVRSYWMVIAAAALRFLAIGAGQWSWALVQVSAALWITAFAMYLWEFFPMMIRPRPEPVAVVSVTNR